MLPATEGLGDVGSLQTLSRTGNVAGTQQNLSDRGSPGGEEKFDLSLIALVTFIS